MSKPLPSQTLFAPLSPPWSLSQLDTNVANAYAAINDIGTYSNTLTDTGAVNALVATPAAGITFALVTGIALDIVVGNTTTSTTPTLNVNATGAKTIVNVDGTALIVGALLATGRYRFIYDGTNWRWQYPWFTSGTFTATGVGFSGSVTGTATYFKLGPIATLIMPQGVISGTSNSTSFSISGLPAVIQPATTGWQTFAVYAVDNGSAFAGGFAAIGTGVPTGSGTITMFKLSSSAGFTASGTKQTDFTITYILT